MCQFNTHLKKTYANTMTQTLSWNNHIDLLMKKLSKAHYIIRNAKTYMSALSLKVVYYAFFHSVMSYGIIFWGNSRLSSIIFRIQEEAIRIMEGRGNRVLCRNLFKKLQILPLTSQYRVSQEEWTKLREGVPYVKLYRYNPKHLYPTSNGYGDNGQRSLKL